MPASPLKNRSHSELAKSQTSTFPYPRLLKILFAIAWGAFLGLALIKLGNPVILNHLIDKPAALLLSHEPHLAASVAQEETSGSGFVNNLFTPWILSSGLWFIGALAVLAGFIGSWPRQERIPKWLLGLPLAWFLWQMIASISTVDRNLTQFTLFHFAAALCCLFMGWHALEDNSVFRWFLGALLVGFILVLWNGFGQHYGGLEATRKWVYEQPDWQRFPPEFMKRVSSGRIYSTLVYPNALAGAILLLLPPLLTALWQVCARFSPIIRGVAAGVLAYSGIACLIWSGSKSAWIIALVIGLLVVMHLKIALKYRCMIIAALLVIGISGFTLRYAGYFQRGATSVSARFDYWRAAVHIALSNPWLGTGPGTFSVPYKQIKAPESEMARLVHNDYLEQASDSGIPGFLAYSLFILVSLRVLYRKSLFNLNPLYGAACLGFLAWAMHGFVEFGLYIPALAWPAFAMLGWLLRIATTATPSDSTSETQMASE